MNKYEKYVSRGKGDKKLMELVGRPVCPACARAQWVQLFPHDTDLSYFSGTRRTIYLVADEENANVTAEDRECGH